MVKSLLANAGDMGLIPELGRSPGEGSDNPLQYSCLEESHGQRSLVGYSPQGHKVSQYCAYMHTCISDAIWHLSFLAYFYLVQCPLGSFMLSKMTEFPSF